MNYKYPAIFICFVFSNSWAHTHVHHHRELSLSGAIQTGIDTNGTPLYLCHARLFNSMQPGKTWAGYNRCNVSYAGREYVVNRFTVPNARDFQQYTWGPGIQDAVLMGRDTNGKPLFICQAKFNGSIQPGKTWPGYNHCNISYAGREIILDHYQVLTNNREIVVSARTAPPQGYGETNVHGHY